MIIINFIAFADEVRKFDQEWESDGEGKKEA